MLVSDGVDDYGQHLEDVILFCSCQMLPGSKKWETPSVLSEVRFLRHEWKVATNCQCEPVTFWKETTMLFTKKHNPGQETVNLNLPAEIKMSFLFISGKEQNKQSAAVEHEKFCNLKTNVVTSSHEWCMTLVLTVRWKFRNIEYANCSYFYSYFLNTKAKKDTNMPVKLYYCGDTTNNTSTRCYVIWLVIWTREEKLFCRT